MHAALFNSLEDSKLVAVADPSKFPATQLGQINPLINVYQDGKEMLENSLMQEFTVTEHHLDVKGFPKNIKRI